MKVFALALLAALPACQQSSPARLPDAAERSAVAEPFFGRVLENGRGRYGEVTALRSRSGEHLRTAVVYRTNGMASPASGEDVAFTVSGVEVECDAGRLRYTYHQGRSADGQTLYQVALPENAQWNSGDRIAQDVLLLCRDLTSEHLMFDNAADFLEKTVPLSPPADAVVSVTS